MKENKTSETDTSVTRSICSAYKHFMDLHMLRKAGPRGDRLYPL